MFPNSIPDPRRLRSFSDWPVHEVASAAARLPVRLDFTSSSTARVRPLVTQTGSANERVRSSHDSAGVALVPHGPSARGEQPFLTGAN
jgi:hypothetical protein